MAKAATQLPGLNEQIGFLTQQLASLRDVQKLTDEKAKLAGAGAELKAAAEKSEAATQAMNTALKAAKVQHDETLARTKLLPETIVAGQQKIEKTADEITLAQADRKSTRLNSSHKPISYAVFCLKKKTTRALVSNPRVK